MPTRHLALRYSAAVELRRRVGKPRDPSARIVFGSEHGCARTEALDLVPADMRTHALDLCCAGLAALALRLFPQVEQGRDRHVEKPLARLRVQARELEQIGGLGVD